MTSTAEQPAEQLIHLDPATLTIATNVRTDLAEDKDFAASIKARGVLEPVTVYLAEDGTYAVLRGQRRTLTAARVGTPTGTIPCRVVDKPEDADRIGDQMVENIHRAGMREREVLAGVEQLALLGVSAAQITKRVSLPRTSVNAALAVVDKKQTRDRVEAGDLTLEQAAIFAEFEGDEDAVERLERSRTRSWGDSLEHMAQRLRDEAAERAADAAEIERLRAEGLPVLTADEVIDAGEVLSISRLVNSEGETLPEEEWPNVPGARVHVTKEWVYPEDEADEDETDEEEVVEDGEQGEEGEDYQPAEPYQVYVPVWVVTDLAASGLHRRGSVGHTEHHQDESAEEAEARAEAEREAKREERRRVIANNKAWDSAEVVRREWLATFLTRKTPPKGAESLICESVITGGGYSLEKAIGDRHPMLRTLTGVGTDKTSWDAKGDLATLAAKANTPKTAIMTTLAAVVTAWEATLTRMTWRGPSPWDARMLTALTEWGYQPSEVERLLLPQPEPAEPAEPEDEADGQAEEVREVEASADDSAA